MKDTYLEITFRKGKILAAYIYLSRSTGCISAFTKKAREGIILDFNRNNEVIGIELTAPSKISITELNQVLDEYHLAPLTTQELAPLLKAA
jgi:hypothetical protein